MGWRTLCAWVLSRFSSVWLFATPWTIAHQALFIGFTRQEYWSGLPFLSPADLPQPGIKPASPMSPALAGGFFTASATGEAPLTHIYDCTSSLTFSSVQFSSVQSLSHVPFFATPWTAVCKASLSTTNSWSLLKCMSIESVTQPSQPLSSPSPHTFNLSHHQGLFQWVSSSHHVAQVLAFQFQHQCFQWIFRNGFL